MSRSHPHRDVADRFRFFLDTVGLSREGFIAAVDGAIGARSLYSVLSGARRPSRALAVLIERTWGLRADYLLAGRGEMWTRASELGAGVVAIGLSTAEGEVIEFMRRSTEDARAVMAELEQIQNWSRLFSRVIELVRELDACGSSHDPADIRVYPLLAKVVYEDCSLMARQYGQFVGLLHERRFHKLRDGFFLHFLERLPRGTMPPQEYEALRTTLKSVLKQRHERLRKLEKAIDEARETIENLCNTGSLVQRAKAHCASDPRIGRRHAAARRLAEMADGALHRELQELLGELAEECDPSTTYSSRLLRLLRDLLSELEQPVPSIETYSAEDLEMRYEALMEPLTA